MTTLVSQFIDHHLNQAWDPKDRQTRGIHRDHDSQDRHKDIKIKQSFNCFPSDDIGWDGMIDESHDDRGSISMDCDQYTRSVRSLRGERDVMNTRIGHKISQLTDLEPRSEQRSWWQVWR